MEHTEDCFKSWVKNKIVGCVARVFLNQKENSKKSHSPLSLKYKLYCFVSVMLNAFLLAALVWALI